MQAAGHGPRGGVTAVRVPGSPPAAEGARRCDLGALACSSAGASSRNSERVMPLTSLGRAYLEPARSKAANESRAGCLKAEADQQQAAASRKHRAVAVSGAHATQHTCTLGRHAWHGSTKSYQASAVGSCGPAASRPLQHQLSSHFRVAATQAAPAGPTYLRGQRRTGPVRPGPNS